MSARRFFIYAEDDPDAVLLVRTVLRKLKVENLLVHCCEGESVINCLHDGLDKGEKPSFILLDLRMPKIDGFEVLRWVRSNPELQRVPVVIWTSSPMENDVQLAAALGAVDYIVKPGSFGELQKKLSALLVRFGLLENSSNHQVSL